MIFNSNPWGRLGSHHSEELATINYGKSPEEILSSYGDYPVVGTGGRERYGDKFIYDGESIVLGRKGTIDRVHFVSGRFWAIDTAYYLSHFVEAVPRWLFYYLQKHRPSDNLMKPLEFQVVIT
ncbi:MAG: restriction endonuclease subunit S [Desulfotignum sp.]|nr:restriction endonuclease subunit S [Desulfotignum sp.]